MAAAELTFYQQCEKSSDPRQAADHQCRRPATLDESAFSNDDQTCVPFFTPSAETLFKPFVSSTSSASTTDNGIFYASSSGSVGSVELPGPPPPLLRFFTGVDPGSTDLNYYHTEALLQDSISMSEFTKMRQISECCGGQGDVTLYTWNQTEHPQVAMKRVPLAYLHANDGKESDERAVHRFGITRQMEDTLTEIGIFCYLSQQQQSPYILQMRTAFQADAHAYLVLQYASGGDLFDVIVDGKASTEQVVRWTWQLLQALDFLHGHRIGHRDISIENILLHDGSVQLMDFGQAVQTHSRDGALLRYFCGLGKNIYRAPERNVPRQSEVTVVAPMDSFPGDVVFARASTSGEQFLCEVRLPSTAAVGQKCTAEPCGYTVSPVDVFASGACLFIMAGGRPPWKEARIGDQHFEYAQANGIRKLFSAHGKQLDPILEDLLEMMLQANPMKRASLAECLAHPLFDGML